MSSVATKTASEGEKETAGGEEVAVVDKSDKRAEEKGGKNEDSARCGVRHRCFLGGMYK